MLLPVAISLQHRRVKIAVLHCLLMIVYALLMSMVVAGGYELVLEGNYQSWNPQFGADGCRAVLLVQRLQVWSLSPSFGRSWVPEHHVSIGIFGMFLYC